MATFQIGPFLTVGLLAWIGALVALFVQRIFSNAINVSGFLVSSSAEVRSSQPQIERMQMLGIFLFSLAAYAIKALTAQFEDGPPALPDVPNSLLVLFGASQAIYLSGKVGRGIFSQGG